MDHGGTFDAAAVTAAAGGIGGLVTVAPYLGLHKRGHLYFCALFPRRQLGSLILVGFGDRQRLESSPAA